MTTTTNGAGQCRTLAGENTLPAPSVARLVGPVFNRPLRTSSGEGGLEQLAPLSPARTPMGRSQTGPTPRAASCVASWLVPTVIGLVITILHFAPTASFSFEFDRAALARGEGWRLLTGHFVHFNASHLAWDAGAFALLASLLPAQSPRRWLVLVIGAALFISVGVWLMQPHFEIYRGLSGVDCALFGALLVERLRAARCERDQLALALVALAAIGFVAKCGVELLSDAPVFAASGAYSPVPLAHFLGAIWGAFVARAPSGVSPFPSSRTHHPNSHPVDARACRHNAGS